MASSALSCIGLQVQAASSPGNVRRSTTKSSGQSLGHVGMVKFPVHKGRGGQVVWGQVCKATSDTSKVPEVVGGGGPGGGDGAGDGGNGGGGGGGGGGSGDAENAGLNPGIAAILAEAGREVSSFPPDFKKGLIDGKVTESVLRRYLSLEKNIFTGILMGLEGFRQRLLADPSFLFKVGIECGIGIGTKTIAEYKKREDVFFFELDFVLANVIMALLADFCLVWLPAPTLRYSRAAKAKSIAPKWTHNIPDNAFQVVQPGMTPFTPFQRASSIVKNGAKLLGVGIGCSAFGVALTNMLIWTRERLDPNFKKAHPPQDVPLMAGAYGLYMGVSSNIRYQVLAGVIEERGIEKFLPHGSQIGKALTFFFRTGNTFLGSLLWVDFLRMTGLQKKTVIEDVKPEKSKSSKKKK